jgi:hypothetical protein
MALLRKKSGKRVTKIMKKKWICRTIAAALSCVCIAGTFGTVRAQEAGTQETATKSVQLFAGGVNDALALEADIQAFFAQEEAPDLDAMTVKCKEFRSRYEALDQNVRQNVPSYVNVLLLDIMIVAAVEPYAAFVTGIEPGTTLSELAKTYPLQAGQRLLAITADGLLPDDGLLGSIMGLCVVDPPFQEDNPSGLPGVPYDYKVALIFGDTDGDGQVTALDMMAVKRVILNKADINDVGAFIAGDVDHDEQVTALDMAGIKRHILRKQTINQHFPVQ